MKKYDYVTKNNIYTTETAYSQLDLIRDQSIVAEQSLIKLACILNSFENTVQSH